MQDSTRRYPKTSRRMLFEIDHFPLEELYTSPDDVDSPLTTFTQDLFNSQASVIIREAAKGSSFIQGMAQGTLDPDIYGGYMVQDAAYCFNAVQTFDMAADSCQKSGNPEFALLFRVYSEKFKTYNQDFVKKWRLKNSDSVGMGPAAAMYVSYERSLGKSQDPRFVSIAMLPCQMLWPWIAGELIGSVNKDNPYYGWFNDNKPDPSGKKSTVERFVNRCFTKPEDKQKAEEIFLEGMVNELNFFRDACGEGLRYNFGKLTVGFGRK